MVFWRVKDVDRNDQDTLVLLTKALSTFLHVKIFKPHVCIFLPELGLIPIENMEKNTEVFAKTLDFDDMLVR